MNALNHTLFRAVLFIAFLTVPQWVSAQTRATIDLSCQKYVGGVSSLDRSKFFTIHSQSRSDTDIQRFMNEYGVSYGRGFWGPYSYAKSKTGQVGVYPAYKGGGTHRRNVTQFVSTEHPANVARYNINVNTAANWAAEYFKNFVDDLGRPTIFEPMNEPFIKAGKEPFKSGQPDEVKMRRRMAEWFGAIGKKIHQTPELANMKVIGYSSAWPSMELWDFGHWNGRMKMFMDVAGPDMDGFSTHIYDGVNVTGQNNQRSGSNAEAILDLIETYSYAKWGQVKPHAITEYGGIEKGYGPEYSDRKFVQAIRSQNHILFSLLEREDRMLISIPFNVDKATWHITQANNYHPYGAALWRPTRVTPTGNPNKPRIDGWAYTSRITFYQLWKDVQGRRVRSFTNDPDIQSVAFISGNKAYIGLNNLESGNKRVNLDFLSGLSGLNRVTVRRLKIYPDRPHQYTANTQSNAPANLDLVEGESVVLIYEFNRTLNTDKVLRSRNYYSAKHLQGINANQAITFDFNGVRTGSGRAVLRMGIGRKHDRSKRPTIKVNGTTVAVPTDWKGYDQRNRTDFFGVIDIPVPGNLIRANNRVTVTFPDGGGRLSSLILNTLFIDGAGGGGNGGELSDGTYFIQSAMNDQRLISRALENYSARMTAPGNFTDQKWEFKHLGNQVYTIQNASTRRYLEIPFEACGNNADVASWTDVLGDHQRWKVVASNTGVYTLRPMHCQSQGMDRANGAVDANVQTYQYNAGNNNQKWRLISANSNREATTTAAQNEILMFPNPVQQTTHLVGLKEGQHVAIYDTKGQLIAEGIASGGQWQYDMSIHPKGLYLIKPSGSKAIRFVKQ